MSEPRYRLLALSSRGGMGLLYRAWDTKLDRPVAIKILANPSDADAQQRAALEAKAATQIRSDHVVQVYDTGTTSDLRCPYLVMELLAGEDLQSVIRRGPVAPMLAVDWILQACEALAHLDLHGLVHRDVKPANLFLETRVDGSRRLKLLDFGVAKQVRGADSKSASLTNDGALIGSIPYVSPEQVLDSRDVDVRADVWGLGTVLYELLAGKPPFEAPHRIDVVKQITRQRHTPLCLRQPELSRGLSQVVDRCLEKKRERRWASIAELACALEPFASERGAELVPRICRIGKAELADRRALMQPSGLAAEALAPVDAVVRLADPDSGVEWAAREDAEVDFIASGPAPTTVKVLPGSAFRWSSRARDAIKGAGIAGPVALAVALGVFAIGPRASRLRPPSDRLRPAAADCLPAEAVYQALDMDHEPGTGTPRGSDWVLFTNGSVSARHVFARGKAELSISAGGDLAGEDLPHLIVSVDGERIGETDIVSKRFATYSFEYDAPGGLQSIALTFSNDYLSGGEDRDLILRELAVGRCAPTERR